MYVMNPRDMSTAPRWKLKPYQTQELESKQSTCSNRHMVWGIVAHFRTSTCDTHMQKGAGRVRHHDGRERPEFERTLKNICETRASACMRVSVWMSHYHAVHNDNEKQEQLPPSSNRCKHCHSQVFRKRDIGRFHDVTTSTIDRGNSIFSGLDTAISLQNKRLKVH